MAVSKHATCGSSGARASTARIAARLWGRCSGAMRDQLLHRGEQGGVDAGGQHVGAGAVGDAVTDGDEAVGAAALFPQPAGDVGERAVVPNVSPAGQRFSSGGSPPASFATKRGAAADALDLAAGDRRRARRRAGANTENLMLDEPAFRTRIASVIVRIRRAP